MTRDWRGRTLGGLAALGLALGVAAAPATPAAAATCPTVDAAGTVTPAPYPGADWAGCDLKYANMPDANLSGANLSGADLSSAALSNADLAGADLSQANLFNANVGGADLAGANLASAQLVDTQAGGADLESADLTGASATGVGMAGADLRKATIHGVDLSGATLDYADFFGASMANLTTTINTSWGHAICPNGADANYYTAGCLSPVSVTTPTATPTITGGTLGNNDWYTSGVTVSWYWVDANPMPNCPASTTSAEQSPAVIISASCTDASGNVGHATQSVKIDTTPPTMTLVGVRDGGVYPWGPPPLLYCAATDGMSGIARNAIAYIQGSRPDGSGVFTVTCSGATDNAGNVAAPFSAHYTLAYDFGGFHSPRPGQTLKASVRAITVRFRLSNLAGKAVPARVAKALAAHHDVRVTLRGPGTSPISAACRWNARIRYLQCAIHRPRHVRTGRRHRYLITAFENLGSGFVAAPAIATSENPEPIYFR